MRLGLLRWGLLLLCWPVAAAAGDVAVRVVELPAAPALAAGHAPGLAAAAPGASKTSVWLRAPRSRTAWYELRLVDDWHGASRPVLAIGRNTRAGLTAYLPPDYRPRTGTVYDAALDPRFSHHAVVWPLPPDLRADQPIYLALGNPGQSQPIQVRVADSDGYRARDLWFVRASTLFTSVQLAMVLVIGCFWVVLRDRMFLYFMVYVAAQIVYAMTVSGELFAMPAAGLLTPFGFHTGQSMAALAAGFSIWFILEFADLPRYTPRLATALGVLRWPLLAFAAIIWMPWLRPDTWLPNTVNVVLIVTTVIALVTGWLAWRRGSRQAGFFLLSWVPLLALTVSRVVQLVAGWPLPAWLEFGFPASMAYAAVIITVGLADRTLQVRHERDHATHMAQFDPLTGIYNRRAILDRLHDDWQAAAAGSRPLAVLFLDIDRFKQINDSRGHAAGDACLCAVTEAIRAELGRADRMGRYGGEEFLIVLNGMSAAVAPQVAERIVARTAALRVPIGEHLIALTVSIGVALRDASMADVETLVGCADAAQYRAKAEGRNRVVVYRREAVAMAPVGERAR
ncbi:MAG TPA: diguanylate cyclase [Rhodanobacteraceae bacterium]|nr:diguanylate cyclase [Rhodanobacteraceae bacterium]